MLKVNKYFKDILNAYSMYGTASVWTITAYLEKGKLQIYSVSYPLRYPILCVQHEWPFYEFLPSKLRCVCVQTVSTAFSPFAQQQIKFV